MPQMHVAGSWTKLREPTQMQSPHRKAPGPLAPRLESVGNKAMFLTWSVEQSGHLAAVADVLFTALCTGGDGCHLETHRLLLLLFFLPFVLLSPCKD